jgi:hypothetical protein
MSELTKNEMLEAMAKIQMRSYGTHGIFNRYTTPEIINKNWVEQIFLDGEFHCNYCFAFFRELIKKDAVLLNKKGKTLDVKERISLDYTTTWNELAQVVSDIIAATNGDIVASMTDLKKALLKACVDFYMTTHFVIPAELAEHGYNTFTSENLYEDCQIECVVPDISFGYKLHGLDNVDTVKLQEITASSGDIAANITSGDINLWNDAAHKVGVIINSLMDAYEFVMDDFRLRMYNFVDYLYHNAMLEDDDYEYGEALLYSVSEIERIQYSPIIRLLEENPNLRRVMEVMAASYGDYVNQVFADKLAEAMFSMFQIELMRGGDTDKTIPALSEKVRIEHSVNYTRPVIKHMGKQDD